MAALPVSGFHRLVQAIRPTQSHNDSRGTCMSSCQLSSSAYTSPSPLLSPPISLSPHTRTYPCLCRAQIPPPSPSPPQPAQSKAAVLRAALGAGGLVQGPCCYDALSARLVEMAGFQVAVMSGFSVSAARLAQPDAGLLSYAEMVHQGGLIADAVSIPVIGDADTGYGNALNVKRTVRGYRQAGMAGVIIEDQVWPKACGHTPGRHVASREEAVMRIRAAVDARNEGGDIVIVARSDARQAHSLAEALWRAQAFADAGADLLFIDALASKDEMREFCRVAPETPKMANMLEGGCTPVLSPLELEEMGFQLALYPLSLLGVSIRAMQDALLALKSGRLPPPSALPSFDEIKQVVGFPHYYKEEARYAIPPSPTPPPPPSTIPNPPPPSTPNRPPPPRPLTVSQEGAKRIFVGGGGGGGGDFESDDDRPAGGGGGAKKTPSGGAVVDVSDSEGRAGLVGGGGIRAEGLKSLGGSWASQINVKIIENGGVGRVLLDVNTPAAFLDRIGAIVPEILGFDLTKLMNESEALKEVGADGRSIVLVDVVGRDGNRVVIKLVRGAL